jgi:uncharacterized OsmC-like protein
MTATAESHGVLNGVDTGALFATIDVVKGAPEAAQFRFRAANRWLRGTHSRSTIHGFFGTGQELEHDRPTEHDADHPRVLTGADNAPTPVEYLLHALAACLTSGLVNIAAARGVTLSEVTSTVEGDINLLGILGLSEEARNGFEQMRVSFTVKGDAPDDKLRELVDQSRNRSAVFDVLTNGVPVSIDVTTG